MSFTDISYLELWCPFIWPSETKCAILVDCIMRNNSVKFFEFGPVVWRKCRLKIFLIWISGSPFVRRSGTICVILVEVIMRNNSMK